MRRYFSLFLLLVCLSLCASPLLAQSATYSLLYSFSGTGDGADPYSPLALGSDGNFYGTAPSGGTNGFGSVYRIAPDGTFSMVYSFTGGAGGQGAITGLVQGSDGAFYGVAGGGANNYGMIYKVTTTGTFTTLYSFTNGSDGGSPDGGLVQGSDGNFYGTTAGGGQGYGTIFKVTPAGELTTLYTFTGGDDGGSPYAGMVQGSDGSFYGTTNNTDGNTFYGDGTVFKISPSGEFANLYLFKGGMDGGNPDGGLVEGPDGNFYGTTRNFASGYDADDNAGYGAIFKITPDGALTPLYDFTGGADGGNPEGTLALGSDGNLYGTTTFNGNGTVYQITLAGKLTTLYTFRQGATGSQPLDGLVQGTDGNLYGTTEAGGENRKGAIFKLALSPALAAPVQLALSEDSVAPGVPVTLSWKVLNASSTTLQQCYASVQNGAIGAGAWSGLQAGTLSDGVYAGSATITPTASGSFTYGLTCGGFESGFATLTVPPLSIATASLPDATVGAAYSAVVSAQNGLGPYVWSVASGNLPAGLTLDAGSGTISGTPTAAGSYSFTVQVADAESVPATATISLSLLVNSATPTVTATPSTMNIAAPGAPGSASLAVSGFSGTAISFACSGLPAGAACSFGTFSGSPSYGTVALQITTTGVFQSASAARRQAGPGAMYAFALPGLLALAGIFRGRRRCARWFAVVALFALLGMSAGLSACGGGSKAPVVTGTPVGTSTVTVTATTGSQSATTTLSLNVQ